MKKNTHKLLTFTILAAATTTAIHLTNRFIASASQLKEMLDTPYKKYYNWRFGDVHYTKHGSGSPLLLIHDMTPGASGYEWHRVESALSQNHTVYTIDLLGCGRSEKPGITYTNFLYVQLICDFIKEVIGEKTDIISSGFSCSYTATACTHAKDLIDKIIFINPPSLKYLHRTPSKKNKLFKFILELPVFGTLIYHMITSRESLNNLFIEKLFYNPFHVKQDYIDTYYESAHKGGYYSKYLYSSFCSKYTNINIDHALADIDNSIYIIAGSTENNSNSIISEYTSVNPAIEVAKISHTKHFPHLEEPKKFLEQINIFL